MVYRSVENRAGAACTGTPALTHRTGCPSLPANLPSDCAIAWRPQETMARVHHVDARPHTIMNTPPSAHRTSTLLRILRAVALALALGPCVAPAAPYTPATGTDTLVVALEKSVSNLDAQVTSTGDSLLYAWQVYDT